MRNPPLLSWTVGDFLSDILRRCQWCVCCLSDHPHQADDLIKLCRLFWRFSGFEDIQYCSDLIRRELKIRSAVPVQRHLIRNGSISDGDLPPLWSARFCRGQVLTDRYFGVWGHSAIPGSFGSPSSWSEWLITCISCIMTRKLLICVSCLRLLP